MHFFHSVALLAAVVTTAFAFPKPRGLLGERQSVGGICDPGNGNGDCTDPSFPYCQCDYVEPGSVVGQDPTFVYVCMATDQDEC